MVSIVSTLAVRGLDFFQVDVECDLSPQFPTFTIVGLASSLVQESRERVRSAIVNSQIEWPARKVVLNLTPTQVPKWGTHFELPMALAIFWAQTMELQSSCITKKMPRVFAWGELSLEGKVKPSPWGLSVKAFFDQEKGQEKYDLILAHPDDLKELSLGLGQKGVVSLEEATQTMLLSERSSEKESNFFLQKNIRPQEDILGENLKKNEKRYSLLASVENEPLGVLAVLVASSEKHHLLLAGPHGTGKTLLAQSLKSLIETQDLSDEILYQRILINASLCEENIQKRPFVSLQTSLSRAALEGSVDRSGKVVPGEISRAHGGVLLIDEFLEYRRDVLESLRQPLEEGLLRLQRATVRAVLPASVQCIATTNLCPCGRSLSQIFACRCSVLVRNKYLQKLSGPLLDRFHMIVLTGQNMTYRKNHCEVCSAAGILLDQFCRSSTWEDRQLNAEKFRYEVIPSYQLELSDLLRSHLEFRLSNRGKMRVQGVAKTLQNMLLSEEKSVLGMAPILMLALWLRDDPLKMLGDSVN